MKSIHGKAFAGMMAALLVGAALAVSSCAAALLGQAGGASSGSSPQGAARQFDDGSITSAVQSKLVSNAETKALDVNVASTNGVVRLSGEVHTSAQSATAERLVWQVKGVKSVKNELRVRGK